MQRTRQKQETEKNKKQKRVTIDKDAYFVVTPAMIFTHLKQDLVAGWRLEVETKKKIEESNK